MKIMKIMKISSGKKKIFSTRIHHFIYIFNVIGNTINTFHSVDVASRLCGVIGEVEPIRQIHYYSYLYLYLYSLSTVVVAEIGFRYG